MKELIEQKWFGGYNTRNWEDVASLYADDAVVHAVDGDKTGGQAVVDIAKKWLEAMPDAQIIPKGIVEDDPDTIVVHWKCEATFEGPVRNLEPTHEKVVFHGLTHFKHRDGKIIEHWATVDYRPLKAPAAV
ncbi:MAG: ester cyclase [Chlamydiia bacterium]|nr:ester cyclase [Chlamydiia bacterium]